MTRKSKAVVSPGTLAVGCRVEVYVWLTYFQFSSEQGGPRPQSPAHPHGIGNLRHTTQSITPSITVHTGVSVYFIKYGFTELKIS